MDQLSMNNGPRTAEIPRSGPIGGIQPLPLRVLGHLISYVFHPLFIPLYVTAFLLYIDPYAFPGLTDIQRTFKLLSVSFNTTFLPGFAVFLMYQLKLIKSMHLATQRERIIPYAVAMVFYFWAWYVSKNQSENPEIFVDFLLGTFLAVCATWMLNINSKISMHSTAMGGMLCFALLLAFNSQDPSGLYVAVAVFIAGMVCTARFLVSDHSRSEIYLGLASGIVTQLIAYWL
ncbi:MAG: hypothetical protein EOO10_00705 [Chitinophagaceae bacterium]|nr:MAG: hypothetical protein EOO10_00705 [Chitinophagaceae bacterium]